MTNQQSVAADFVEILMALDSRLGQSPLVLAGLCAGADNAIRLALAEPRVVGMVLLDAVSFPDQGLGGFKTREFIAKYTSPERYIGWMKRRLKAPRQSKVFQARTVGPVAGWAIRDLPTLTQLRSAFEAIRDRQGEILAVFTDYAREYYNQTGQLGRSLKVDEYQQFCTEIFWPHAHHTYWSEQHRLRLIEEVCTWAERSLRK
jgi:pimeloyl-ACP methyl ester carboxylesterase